MLGTADVVVIGGGVMGCAALYYLTRLGVERPLLLERDTLASGSTGRSMAILRMHYSNEVTTRMALESHHIIANFEDEVGAPGGFVETGYFFLAGAGQEEPLWRNVELGRRLGVDTRALSPDEAAYVMPDCFVLDGVAAAAYEPHSGYADSSAVTNGFATGARAAGAEVRLGVTVTGISTERGRVSGVETDGGRIESGAVVLTAGPWAPEFLSSVGAPLPLSWVRHQVVKIRRPLDAVPTLPTVADLPAGLSFRQDSGDVTLIGVREEPVDRDGYNQSVDADVAQRSMQALARRVPVLEEAGWDGGWSGLFTTTPDWHPVIDRVPGVEGLVCGVGFSGHGFKLAPSIGLALAGLVVNGHSTTIDISPLRFTRFAEGDMLQSAYGATVFA